MFQRQALKTIIFKGICHSWQQKRLEMTILGNMLNFIRTRNLNQSFRPKGEISLRIAYFDDSFNETSVQFPKISALTNLPGNGQRKGIRAIWQL